LVVEDNLLNQKLAQAVLGEEGFEVTLAENGQVAVDTLREKIVDFVLMDIQMPVMDGYQATKMIRHDLKISTPIIAMTANAMAGEREKCINGGMDDYITKPFNPDVLFSIMKKFLRANENSSNHLNEKLTDLSYLRGFSGGKDSFVKDILNVFLEQNPIDIKNLEEAIEVNDLKTIKAIAHSLQTSLGFIGFKSSLIGFLKEAEVNIIDGKEIEQTKINMQTIIECCKQAQEELKEELFKM
jgi:CheY-like chemotaxis protein